MSFTIKFKRGTASEWNNSAAPSGVVLALGEPGYEKDTGKLKIGNGTHPWALLPYVGSGADDETVRDLIATFIQNGSGISVVHDDSLNMLTIHVTGLNSSYISDFNEAVDDRVGSGLFIGGTGVLLSYNDVSNSFTVSTTGVSLSGHTHTVSDISNFSSSISGLLPTIANSGDNRILTSTGTTTGINGESNLTFDGSLLNITGGGNFSGSISGSLLNIDNIRIDGNTILSTNTNGSLYIVPTGTGSLQADTRGNLRGQYSVDLQRSRVNDTRVSSGHYSVILGGFNNISSNSYTTIAGGYNNSATSNSSAVLAGYSNTANGDYSLVAGGLSNAASSSYSALCGGHNNNSTNTGSSLCGGGYNNALGEYSHVGGGYNNQSIANYSSVVGGISNIASASGSAILGGQNNKTEGMFSIAGGKNASTTLYGEHTYSAGLFNEPGDAQTRRFILRGRDTTNSTIHLKLDGDLVGSTHLYIPDWTSWYYTIKVIARRNTPIGSTSVSPTSDTGAYRFEGAIENKDNDGSSCTLLGNTKNIIHEDTAGWDCNISIMWDANNKAYLDIECSYDHTTEDVYWVANVEVVQVSVPIEGPVSILACGFGTFTDGEFSSGGFYNDREYYVRNDSGTYYYLFWNGSNWIISSSLGGSILYSSANYTPIGNAWTVGAGSSPGGDTYDYALTSVCPIPIEVLACGFGSFADGVFTENGTYNSNPYFYNNVANWYLFWDGSYWVMSPSLGGNTYYYNTSYFSSNWNVTSGASPGGDTYDYSITSQCPSGSSSSSSGP